MGGNAWSYLVDSVAGELAQGADAARYYAGAGTPPGRFLGRGLDGLGPTPSSVKAGDEVSAEMLHRMLAQMADPVTGQAVGKLPALGDKAPVAGFDMTFAPAKSVSVMWAMADPPTRAAVEQVLSQALSEVIAWAEDHVFFTRTGARGARQESVRGVIASAWLHYQSRDGDCQVHHHVVVWNRAQLAAEVVAIAARRGAERSAHQAMAVAWERATSFEQLVAEHQSLVAAEAAQHFGAVLDRSGLPADVLAQFRRSGEWDGLLGAMRMAADAGVDVEDVLAGLESAKPILADEDPAARLLAGLQRLARAAGRGPRPNGEMVAGLVPRAGQLDDKDMARAVREREDAIARRARDLAEAAVGTGEAWAKAFGPAPARPAVAEAWWDRLAVIAAYRDRWGITAPGILGDITDIGSLAQAAHRSRALQAGQEAARLAGLRPPMPAATNSVPGVGVEAGIEL